VFFLIAITSYSRVIPIEEHYVLYEYFNQTVPC